MTNEGKKTLFMKPYYKHQMFLGTCNYLQLYNLDRKAVAFHTAFIIIDNIVTFTAFLTIKKKTFISLLLFPQADAAWSRLR